MPEVEQIRPYGDDDGRGKGAQVEAMFDSIAPAYDLMNRLMTLGIDKRWRRSAIRMLRADGGESPRYILDVATGTADLALYMAKVLEPVSIVGIDLSEEMLAIGRNKVAQSGLADMISLRKADCMQLPFPAGTFDCVTVSYGIRNFEDLSKGLSEMFRVLQPGGRLLILELSTPRNFIVKPIYGLYTSKIIPFIGRTVSKDLSAYSYLPASIAAVPQGREMAELMNQAGFQTDVKVKRMTFGTCTAYLGIHP